MKARRISRDERNKIARRQKRRGIGRPAYDERLQFVLQTCPGYNLGKAYKRVTRAFEEEFRSADLTLPQFAVLVNTGVTESATASEIAHRLGSDLSTISRTMDLMVERGLVDESRAKDRRVRVYRLTSAGQEALNRALPKWKTAKRRVLRNVDQSDWDSTLETLGRLAG